MLLMGKSFGGAVATYLALQTASDSTPARTVFSGLCLECAFTSVADIMNEKTKGYLPAMFYSDLKWPTI
jgi:pimeloyl-ACP methyl ester carboxylesterase